MKICYSCLKPFCNRKGRGKAVQVTNATNRYLCKQCTDKQLDVEADENRGRGQGTSQEPLLRVI